MCSKSSRTTECSMLYRFPFSKKTSMIGFSRLFLTIWQWRCSSCKSKWDTFQTISCHRKKIWSQYWKNQLVNNIFDRTWTYYKITINSLSLYTRTKRNTHTMDNCSISRIIAIKKSRGKNNLVLLTAVLS